MGRRVALATRHVLRRVNAASYFSLFTLSLYLFNWQRQRRTGHANLAVSFLESEWATPHLQLMQCRRCIIQPAFEQCCNVHDCKRRLQRKRPPLNAVSEHRDAEDVRPYVRRRNRKVTTDQQPPSQPRDSANCPVRWGNDRVPLCQGAQASRHSARTARSVKQYRLTRAVGLLT